MLWSRATSFKRFGSISKVLLEIDLSFTTARPKQAQANDQAKKSEYLNKALFSYLIKRLFRKTHHLTMITIVTNFHWPFGSSIWKSTTGDRRWLSLCRTSKKNLSSFAKGNYARHLSRQALFWDLRIGRSRRWCTESMAHRSRRLPVALYHHYH